VSTKGCILEKRLRQLINKRAISMNSETKESDAVNEIDLDLEKEEYELLEAAKSASSGAIRTSFALGLTITVIEGDEIVDLLPGGQKVVRRKIARPNIDLSHLKKGSILKLKWRADEIPNLLSGGQEAVRRKIELTNIDLSHLKKGSRAKLKWRLKD